MTSPLGEFDCVVRAAVARAVLHEREIMTKRLNGWLRIWVVLSVLWAAFVFMSPFTFRLWLVPVMGLYLLGWSVAWIRHGFVDADRWWKGGVGCLFVALAVSTVHAQTLAGWYALDGTRTVAGPFASSTDCHRTAIRFRATCEYRAEPSAALNQHRYEQHSPAAAAFEAIQKSQREREERDRQDALVNAEVARSAAETARTRAETARIQADIAAKGSTANTSPSLRDVITLSKVNGACGILTQQFDFQTTTQMNGGAEFLMRFWSTETARLGTDLDAFTMHCHNVETFMGEILDTLDTLKQ